MGQMTQEDGIFYKHRRAIGEVDIVELNHGGCEKAKQN